MKGFETPEHTEDLPSQKDDPVDLSPTPETGKKMEESLNKQEEVRRKEATNSFCERLDGFMTEYSAYKVTVGGDEYTLKLEHIEKEGERVDKAGYKKLKEDLNKETHPLNSVGGVFLMKGNGVNIEYSLPAKLMVSPDGIKDRLVNDFSGGADYYKQKNAPVPAPETEEKHRDAEAQKNAATQAKEAAAAARAQGGEPSILSGESLTTIIINFPQGKQMRISSTPGAVWSCEEVDNGKRVQKGTKATPLEFIVPSEGDPGA